MRTYMKHSSPFTSFVIASALVVGGVLAAATVADAATTHQHVLEDMIVPAFTLSELQLGTRDNDLFDVLTTTGLLAVRVPTISTQADSSKETKGGSRTERRLLAELCQCGDKIGPQIQGGDKILLSDGVTTRSTIATATSGSHHPLPLPKKDIEDTCGLETFASLEQVRGYVSHAASNAFIPALDRLIKNKSSTSAAAAGGELESSSLSSSSTILLSTSKPETATTTTGTSGHRDYFTVTSIVEDAVHLEHFHVYSQVKKQEGDLQDSIVDASSTSTASAAVVDHALDWHTDGGLFLAFLPAESCNQEGTARTNTEHDDSFRIKRKVHDPHSEKDSFTEVRAVFPEHQDDDGEIIVAIMLGEGAETWLNTPKSLKLRATRHAVKMRNGESRAWYGMMHLVPSDAIVVKSHGTTFSELRKTSKPHQQHGDVHDDGNSVASASLGDASFDVSFKQRRNLQHVGGPDECNNLDSFYCWLSCLEIPSDDEYSFQENVALGKSLYCLDPGTLNTTNNLSQAVAACSNSTTGAAGGIMKMTCGNYWYDTDENVQTYTSLFTGDLSGGGGGNETDDGTGPNDTESSSGAGERLKYITPFVLVLVSFLLPQFFWW